MAATLYASVLALLLVWLSLNVIRNRRASKVIYGDGGVEALTIARTAQSNAVDYIPISLIMLYALELSVAPVWLVHLSGIVLVAGRLIHARSILREHLRGRVLGMQLTLFNLIALALLNLAFAIYQQLT